MKTNVRDAIEGVIIDYLEGMIYGQPEKLKRAMHPLCMQAGHFRGQYEFFNRDEFIKSLEGETPEKPGTPIRYKIESIDLSGDVVVARVIDECFGTTFTDYLSFIFHEGRWQIVMKAFYDRGREVEI